MKENFEKALAAVEATAAELALPVVLEGYPPPRDPRLSSLAVTPDPGVIEVNIHPAHDWDELVDHTEFLYEAAHQTRLSTEKFMLDGRHTGTGAGAAAGSMMRCASSATESDCVPLASAFGWRNPAVRSRASSRRQSAAMVAL